MRPSPEDRIRLICRALAAADNWDEIELALPALRAALTEFLGSLATKTAPETTVTPELPPVNPPDIDKP